MKVSTDACLFGAWVEFPAGTKAILDIGTGTGLLSLMAAQRYTTAEITAVEMEQVAADQARENFKESPFGNRLQLVTADILTWETDVRFDAIICNPPFFKNDLTGPDSSRNTARHEAGLNLPLLFKCATALAAAEARFAILLPASRRAECIDVAASAGWWPERSCAVYPTRQKAPNRWMAMFGRGSVPVAEKDLHIYDAPGIYSPQFSELLNDYYLNI